ncbi:hypothetical protein, partial [Photobacterium sp. R1]
PLLRETQSAMAGFFAIQGSDNFSLTKSRRLGVPVERLGLFYVWDLLSVLRPDASRSNAIPAVRYFLKKTSCSSLVSPFGIPEWT